MSLELETFKEITKNKLMSLKQITDSLFGMEAMIGWLSSGFLLIVNLAVNSKVIDGITAWAGAAFAIGTGFFAMLRMYESWKEAKAKRKIVEHEEHQLHDEDLGI
jgi:hypothetical protein